MVRDDRNGNKYYENHNELNLRHRWVDYAADNEFNASQVDPLWHSWLHHIRQLPPHEDPGIQKMSQSWMTVSANRPQLHAKGYVCEKSSQANCCICCDDAKQTPRENITGTRGGFKTYNTVKPKTVRHHNTTPRVRYWKRATTNLLMI